MSFPRWQHGPPVNISDATIHLQKSSHTNQIKSIVNMNHVRETNHGGKSNRPVLSQMLVATRSPCEYFPCSYIFQKSIHTNQIWSIANINLSSVSEKN